MALPKLDVPRYEMKIPSTGKKAVYRPYLVKEEKILMLAMESNDQKQMVRALKDVISSCTEGGVDVDQLTVFDMEYIILQLRGKSVGETTEIGVKCTSCETKNDVSVNLDRVKIDVPKDSQRKIKLTDNVGVVMKYPSVNTLTDANIEDASSVDTAFDIIIECIDSIYSGSEIFDAKDQSKQELKEFIESLNTEQFNKVKQFIETMPSASLSVDFKCSNCGTDNNLTVKGLANFFG